MLALRRLRPRSRCPRCGRGAAVGRRHDVAARAAGTSIGEPVDKLYPRLSGTSMATAHVGAAVLLAQRHPDWSGRQLKAALVSSADPAAAQPVFGTGSGRLDAARDEAADVRRDWRRLPAAPGRRGEAIGAGERAFGAERACSTV
ncbi:S8 family serine peptidase [Streptomyces sp. NPDC051243]|uniref:S8 family serine peptidase n=1 Tax=Streptomyces sp. NPDC051243 TaxID=3365646 RepID=UPI003799AFA4